MALERVTLLEDQLQATAQEVKAMRDTDVLLEHVISQFLDNKKDTNAFTIFLSFTSLAGNLFKRPN